MAYGDPIRNPIEWCLAQFAGTGQAAPAAPPLRHHMPALRRIGMHDLGTALSKGFADFTSHRADVLLICLVYPLAGLILGRAAAGYDMLPMVFPLLSGFALVGPVFGLGLYEMSRQREQGAHVNWLTPLDVARSPAFGRIVLLALLMFAIFAAWLLCAWFIYLATLGPEPPRSIAGFADAVLTTTAGWTMIVVGFGVGFVFALLALAVGVFSFPMLLDRNVTLGVAVKSSIEAVRSNPREMAAWGLIVAGGLVLGSLPLLAGLIVALPVLGHATWHLYRRTVVY